MRYTQHIFILLLFIFVLFVKSQENDKNELETKFLNTNFRENYQNLTYKNFLEINNTPQNILSLPRPLNLPENSYKLEIVFDSNQTINNDDKPRKLHRIQLKNPNITISINAALETAAQKGMAAMKKFYDEIEPNIIEKGQLLNANHPGTLLSKFSAPYDLTENNEKAAYATLTATKYFQKSFKLRATEFGRQSTDGQITFRRTSLEGLCPPRELPICLPAALRYRTHDGTCNNIRRPRWGSAQLPFNRFLPPDYEDGIDTIRESIDGGPLASARFISLLIHGAKDGNAPVTLMLAQWGQLIDHDLTSTVQPRSINGSIPSCCGSDDKHPSCFPIKVPFDDPWLAPLKVRCLEFLRSAPAHRRDCALAWREQTNQVTSFLDASPIYSSNARISDNARVFRNGLLVFGRGNPHDDICLRGAISGHCIRAGDARSNEQPGLLALHLVWVGEHNRIAQELSNLNPHWSDEKIYQETRRIIGALFQHITYREFLPLVLGREVCRLFDLELLNSGFYTKYDPLVNPTVANSFSAAAFRFGHSLIQNSYLRCDRNHNFINNNVSLHDEFSRGDLVNIESLHRLLRGMAAQKSQTRDEFITPELTNHLFQSGGFPFGLDLAAINIQRGRDHGIPRYTAWREPCGLSRIERWEDLETIIGPQSTIRMSHAYQSVHDIDLFVGGIAERPVIGGLVGPTFACIIAQQFSNIRRGDRFWYENFGFENSFTPAQLNAIRRVNFAQVLCRAIGSGTLQPHIFIPHDISGNERIPCGIGLLAPIDLLPWLERDPFFDKLSSDLDAQESVGLHHEIIKPQNVTLINRIDFIPNGSTGIQILANVMKNVTKIHNKLDFKQKSQPHKVSQNVHNKINPQIQVPTESKETQELAIIPPTMSGILMFNNIPITISPILFNDEQLRGRINLHPGRTDDKSDRQLDDNIRSLTKEKTNTIDKTSLTELHDKTNNIHVNSSDHLNNILYMLTTDTQTTVTRTDNNVDSICENCNNDQNRSTETKFHQGSTYNSKMMSLKATTLEYDSQYDEPEAGSENSLNEKKFKINKEITKRIKRDLVGQNRNTDNKDARLDKGQDNTTELTNFSKEQIWENLQKFENNLTNNLTTTRTETSIDITNGELDNYRRFVPQEQETVTPTLLRNEQLEENTALQANLPDKTTEIDEQTPISTTSTIASEFNPEFRTYSDYFTTIDTSLPTSTATQMTYSRRNSTTVHQLDGKIEFLNETKFIGMQQANFENPQLTTAINQRASIPGKKQQQEITVNSIPFLVKRNTQNKPDIHLVDVLKKIFTNNPGRGTLSVSSHPKVHFNLTYVNSTQQLELRQPNQAIIYGSHKHPQKIVLESPESEEYEIEINIRPFLNKKPSPISYVEGNSNNQYENSYGYHNNEFPSTTFNYRRPTRPATLSSFNENSDFYGQRTKPPTIIYVDEKEQTHRFPTRPPQQLNAFQNAFSIDTSTNFFGQYHYSMPPKNLAASSSSSGLIGGNGVASASSSSSASAFGTNAIAMASASSGGVFGSISGSTSNIGGGGGSSPIFNVKVRPILSPTSAFSHLYSTSATPYEFLDSIDSQKPTKHTSSPYSHHYSNPTLNKPSAFSNNRLDEHYDNFHLLTSRPIISKLSSYQRLYNNGHIEARSPKTEDSDNTTTEYPKYDNNGNDDVTTSDIQFDQDGYLRPEYMTFDSQNSKNILKDKNLNRTKFNDDYVLPLLRRNLTDINLKKTQTTFPDTIPRQSNFEILAEDTFVINNDTNKTEERKASGPIAFAPLRLLTRPERPDDWVVVNTSETKPLLPEQPELKPESLISQELPKPMARIKVGILKPILMKSETEHKIKSV